MDSPCSFTKQWCFPFQLTPFPPLSCHVTHTLAQLQVCCRSIRKDQASSSQLAWVFYCCLRVINNGISLVVMIVKSFFLFNSSLSEPRLRRLIRFASPSHISQAATTHQRNYLLFLKIQNAVFLHLPMSETLLSLRESTYLQKYIQVLKPVRKHRENNETAASSKD